MKYSQTTDMTYRELIDQWPTLVEYASDVGVGYEAAKQQRRRNAIKHAYWEPIVQAAKRRGFKLHGRPITIELLAHIAAQKSQVQKVA